MLTLPEVLDVPELGLALVGRDHSDSNEIRWAHVSELADPSPWLLGGEFLLTTGANLPTDPDATHQYCERLVNAGVVAVGFSAGPRLPHPHIPDALVASAEATSLTLVQVPERTLLQAIVHSVADLIHERADTPVRRVSEIVRQLNELSTLPNGITRIVERLGTEAGMRAVIYDEWLRPITATDHRAEDRFRRLRRKFQQRLASGMRWSISTVTDKGAVMALPLGTEGRLRGILAVGKEDQFSSHDRLIIGSAVSLCSVLLELRIAGQAPQRAARTRLVDGILADKLNPQQVAGSLSRLGIDADRFAVLIADCASTSDSLRSIVAAAADHAPDLLLGSDGPRGAIIMCSPRALDALADGSESPANAHAGISAIVGIESLQEGVRQARLALQHAIAIHRSTASYADFPGYRTLLSLGQPEFREAFAKSVLGPLHDSEQPSKRELIDTLAVYCRSGGRLEEAAEELGVHRHTMRARIRRISEITGRNLDRGQDLFEVWLAIELRGMGEFIPGREAERA